jgi:3'-phosphoadenosine 5'-phosphosulfate (PAPS) 3'-phosphatase
MSFSPFDSKKKHIASPNPFSNQLYWQLAPLSGTCHFVKKPKSQATYGTVVALLKAKKGIMVFAYFIFSATLFAMAVDVATEE